MRSIIFLLCLCTISQLQAQTFTLQYGKKGQTLTTEQLSDTKSIVTDKPEVMKIVSDDTANIFVIFKEGDDEKPEVNTEFKGKEATEINMTPVEFAVNGKATFQIKKKGDNKVLLTFNLVKLTQNNPQSNDSKNNNGLIITSTLFSKFWDQLGFENESTQYGLVVKSGNTLYKGKQFVHIFLDQYGNSIYGTMPQGIADRQYVVHVIYQTGINTDLAIFDIKKTKGNFNPALNYLNSEIGKSSATSGKTDSTKNTSNYTWVHKEFLLGTSTTDVEFDLTKTTIANVEKPYDYKNDKISSYAINMTPTYHGSFNVGFVNSSLENPTYQLVENPLNSSEKVVKRTNTGNRGVTTLMATIYTSPIVLIERLFNKDIPWNKTYGRNFLDDHKIYERLYPVIGVGFTDKSLENVFYGLNWEVTRGAGIFFGWHWGKVNTYKTTSGFEFEKTPTTQAEFDLNTNQQWKTSSLCVGVNIDPSLILRLFNGNLK